MRRQEVGPARGRLSPSTSGRPNRTTETPKEMISMADELQGKRVAFLFTEGVEQVELTEPLEAVRGAGGEADLISLEQGEVEMWQHFDKGEKIEAEHAVSDVQ